MLFTPQTVTVTEPISEPSTTTVQLAAEGTPAAGGVTTYTINSVTCNELSEFVSVNGSKDIVISFSNNSFTFTSMFRDLFDRTFKFTRHYPKEYIAWKNKDLSVISINADGSNVIKIKVSVAELFRPGDTIEISAATVETNEKDKISGTWSILSVTGYNAQSEESQKFSEITVKVNENIQEGIYYLLDEPYNTYHVVNRIRYISNIDENTTVEPYTGVYQVVPPESSRNLSFTVSGIKTYTSYSSSIPGGPISPGTPVNTAFTEIWSMTLNSAWQVTQNALQMAIESGSDYIENQNNNPDIP